MQVFIHLGAVCCTCRAWLNGAELGFSTDSKLPESHPQMEAVSEVERMLLGVCNFAFRFQSTFILFAQVSEVEFNVTKHLRRGL